MKTMNTKGLEKQIRTLEKKIVQLRKKALGLRRKQAYQEVRDYALKAWDGREVRLSSLFGDKQDLLVIHNMGRKCPYCTTWADGFNGVLHHLEDRAGFVVVSPDDPETQKAFARSRGWKFQMLSGHESPFIEDMGYGKRGTMYRGYQPGVSAFHKAKDGRIFRVAKASFGPGDDFCIVWNLLDLLKSGSRGWSPKFSYPHSTVRGPVGEAVAA